ncbi:hypothetical protein EGJ57_06520 [Brucella anthropi]|nr:hypothetical protein EGJ57_06520 [Brucella anthropi]
MTDSQKERRPGGNRDATRLWGERGRIKPRSRAVRPVVLRGSQMHSLQRCGAGNVFDEPFIAGR